MTSRDRFEAEFLKLGGHTSALRHLGEVYYYTDTALAFKLWQAAERDMLERAIALIQSHQDGGYRAELIVIGLIRQLKELLNEPR